MTKQKASAGTSGDATSASDSVAASIAEQFNHSRETMEKGMRAVQEHALQFLTMRLEHNGRAIEECRNCKDVTDLMAAQQKWLSEFGRDYYEASLRFNEMTHRLLSDGISEAKAAEAKHDAAA